MRAIPAIYDEGRVFFSFSLPDYDGPVSVLVVFPDQDQYELTDTEEPEIVDFPLDEDGLDFPPGERLFSEVER